MGNLGCDRKRAINELVRGKEFAKRLKNMMNESGSSGDDDVSSTSPALEAEDLVKAVLTCFGNTLCILLKSTTHDVASSSPKEDTDARKSPEYSGDSSCRTTSTTLITKVRRGCYKRRKTCQSWTQDSSIPMEDGHAWRKYGQKSILNAKYPRSYFRCTHKHDQGCKANKQVQRIDEEDHNPFYRTTYYGHHTCTNDINLITANSNELVEYDDQDRKDASSLIDFRRQPKDDNNNNNNNNNSGSSFFTSIQSIKQEHLYNNTNKLDQDMNIPINHHHLSTYKYNHEISYSSSSDFLVSPFDQATDHVSCTTTSTPTTLDMGGFDDYDDDALQFDF